MYGNAYSAAWELTSQMGVNRHAKITQIEIRLLRIEAAFTSTLCGSAQESAHAHAPLPEAKREGY